jgi:predicted aspartyl protease
MTTVQSRRPALQPQVSASLRFAAAVAIAAILALAWIGAEQASHQAVQTATAAISRGAAPAAKPAMEVAGHREAAAAKRI